MTKRLSIILVALLALGFVFAGCGDDNDTSKEETPVATAPATAEPGPTGPTGPTEPAPAEDADASAASGVPDSPEAKQAVEACKKQTEANPQLSAEAKTKIGEVCEEAGSGDADGALKATAEACEILVKDTVPAGTAQETALDACEQSTQTP